MTDTYRMPISQAASSRIARRAVNTIGRCADWALIALLLSTAAGCGSGNDVKEKPTSEEIRAMRAQIDAEPAPAPEPAPPVTMPGGAPMPVPVLTVPAYHPWGVKETAVDALGRIGEEAVPNLIIALAQTDPSVRAQAARALARIGPDAKEAVPALMQHLDDVEEEVRQASARALGQIGPAASPAVPALIGIIESSDGKAPPSTLVPQAPIAPRRSTTPPNTTTPPPAPLYTPPSSPPTTTPPPPAVSY